jgi:ferredoxin
MLRRPLMSTATPGSCHPAIVLEILPGSRLTWVVSHKPGGVAAGLGMMGIHRNVIHEKFGNFILLGTILLDAEVSETSRPIDYNPCLECKLCVAACPVGPSPRKEISTSQRATPTTTGSSWEASPIGSNRWPTAVAPVTTANESVMRSRRRYGRVHPAGRPLAR